LDISEASMTQIITREITYDAGLDKTVLFILSYHVGSERAIGREALVLAVAKMGQGVNERAARQCIHDLRRKGHLILSMPGIDGGYYMADSLAEFETFDRMEFGAKISDMNETRQAMLKAAKIQFGEAVQVRLI
jgi:hypothetical protein